LEEESRTLYKVVDLSEEHLKDLQGLSAKAKGEGMVVRGGTSWLTRILPEKHYIATSRYPQNYVAVLRPFWVRVLEKRPANKIRVEVSNMELCKTRESSFSNHGAPTDYGKIIRLWTGSS
jgi:hypothetical protein